MTWRLRLKHCENCEGVIAYRRYDQPPIRDKYLPEDTCRCRDGDEKPLISAVDLLGKVGSFLPTDEDIGRGVVYQAHPDAPYEDGVITSLNASYVFVRYASQHPGANGQATPYNKLKWLHER